MVANTYGTGYYAEAGTGFSSAMPQNTISYQPDYGQDGRQTQTFAPYSNSLIYPLSQNAPQTPVYDGSQQFSASRQAIPPLGLMNTSVGTPYFTEATADPPVTAPSIQSHTQSSSSSTSAFPQTQLPSYGSNIPGVGSMAQTTPDTTDVSMGQGEYSAGAGLEEKWSQYQSALRSIFRDVMGGALESAQGSLMTVTNWLLSQVVDLGTQNLAHSGRWQEEKITDIDIQA